MIVALLDEAVAHGARRRTACEVLGVSARMVERWHRPQGVGGDEDLRRGPTTAPRNKLSPAERERVLEIVNAPRFRDLSPNQMVPRLADEGTYLSSESTVYRILREEEMLAHRGRAKAPERRGPNAHTATDANQVWSWDITYLKSPVRGLFYYLHLIMDVWSRKIVGWDVQVVESAELAAALFSTTCRSMGIDPMGIVLHADNGGPMKGSTMVTTLEQLGVLASYSRPGVSDDNPFSESLFRTMKYRPEYPHGAFANIEAVRRWVEIFVGWYNTEHLHSGIRFVTPEDRHHGRERAILAQRRRVYARARAAHPERWTRGTRNWDQVVEVRLNPPKTTTERIEPQKTAA
jgi:transposase InsO family protein